MTVETSKFKWIDIQKKDPYGVVLAINYQQAILVGTCINEGEGWVCQDECQRLEGVTHYVNMDTLLSLHQSQLAT